jgi:hypothetical protein
MMIPAARYPSTDPSLKRRKIGIAMTAAARNMAIWANKLIMFVLSA